MCAVALIRGTVRKNRPQPNYTRRLKSRFSLQPIIRRASLRIVWAIGKILPRPHISFPAAPQAAGSPFCAIRYCNSLKRGFITELWNDAKPANRSRRAPEAPAQPSFSEANAGVQATKAPETLNPFTEPSRIRKKSWQIPRNFNWKAKARCRLFRAGPFHRRITAIVGVKMATRLAAQFLCGPAPELDSSIQKGNFLPRSEICINRT